MESYITVSDISYGEYTEKHSRFIATLYPCHSEPEAAEILCSHKAKYFDARHNVYAYILSDNTARFSDDGEPHGTAAKPILDVLSHSGVVDALLVVTRYFGGILLGTGGLVRAYSTSAKQALENASLKYMTECSVLSLDIPYSMQGKLMSLLSDIDADIIETRFEDTVKLLFAVEKINADDFNKKLCEATSSKISATHKYDKILPKTIKK